MKAKKRHHTVGGVGGYYFAPPPPPVLAAVSALSDSETSILFRFRWKRPWRFLSDTLSSLLPDLPRFIC